MHIQKAKFWYSQRQAEILARLGKTLNVCRVELCGECVDVGYTCCTGAENENYSTYEPAANLEAVFLGEGVLVKVNQDAEGWSEQLESEYLGKPTRRKHGKTQEKSR